MHSLRLRSSFLRWFALLVFLTIPAVSISAQDTLGDSWRVRLAFNNDYLTNNSVDDDFYTFGTRVELSLADWTWRWEENAFTDRVDGLRFDETYLTAGRFLPAEWTGLWDVWVEAGVAHVGRGLLGQSAQNSLHDLIGDEEVRLDYLDVDDYQAHLHVEVGRSWPVAARWDIGPQLGFSVSQGFRGNALAGLRVRWQIRNDFSFETTVGARFAGTRLALLEPHLEESSPAAQVEFDLPAGLFVQWSLNRYGSDREHVSFGYRFGTGNETERRPGVVP